MSKRRPRIDHHRDPPSHSTSHQSQRRTYLSLNGPLVTRALTGCIGELTRCWCEIPPGLCLWRGASSPTPGSSAGPRRPLQRLGRNVGPSLDVLAGDGVGYSKSQAANPSCLSSRSAVGASVIRVFGILAFRRAWMAVVLSGPPGAGDDVRYRLQVGERDADPAVVHAVDCFSVLVEHQRTGLGHRSGLQQRVPFGLVEPVIDLGHWWIPGSDRDDGGGEVAVALLCGLHFWLLSVCGGSGRVGGDHRCVERVGVATVDLGYAAQDFQAVELDGAGESGKPNDVTRR